MSYLNHFYELQHNFPINVIKRPYKGFDSLK